MKLFYSPLRGTLLHVPKFYSRIFHHTRLMLLFLLVFSAGCKKVVEETGIVGVCPIVTATDPTDKAVDVALAKLISVTFNTDMNPASITATSFTIRQGTQIISGTVAPTSNGAVFTFKPDVPLLPFLTYTGTITTAATDKFRTAMVADYVWTFTTIPQLTVTPNLVAGGTVTGAGTFAQGSTVTVNATPKTGYTFTSWTDSASTTVLSTSPSFQFKMAGNRALVANFTIIPPAKYAVVLSSNPVAGGSTYGSGSYDVGTTVTVIESPNPGYTFLNWTENGTVVSTSSSFQFVIAGNRTFVANFSIVPSLQYAVILSSNPPAGGTNTGSGSYTSGTSVTITATPNTGYSFVNFTENGTVISTSASFTFPITSTRIIVANFVINTYTLTATANPAAGGTITKNPDQPKYDYGTQVLLTATPATGYRFANWTENGTIVSTSAAYQVSMTTNRVLVANFTLNSYGLTLTINPTAGGSVTKNPDRASYDSGSTVVLTATANPGYTFTSWAGDASGSTNPLTVVMNSNKNIVANFTPTPVVIPLINLGTAANFGAFGGNAGITNQGINTVINNGSIGTTAASTLITGFHDMTGDKYTETILNIGDVKQRIYTAAPPPVIFAAGGPYGGNAVTKAIADQGLADANAAYISISPASKPGGTDPGAGELGGLTLAPGVYKAAGGTFNISLLDLTLDGKGDPNATWIFQTAAGLTVGTPAGARSVKLIGGAQAKNVFWYVGSAAVINYAGGGVMVGTVISTSGVTISNPGASVIGPQAVVNGRVISLVASVTMVNTTINNQ
ncbi:MAG: ice-binding family protein [Sediminibacterium sp.]